MLLASYKSTRAGWRGLANRLIRWRLDGQYSHTEVVFEPGDGVDALMPDGDCQPDAGGALWCASSVATERLPAWSHYRAGGIGGVRFKRITLDPTKWELIAVDTDPRFAARTFVVSQGRPYSWRLIAKTVAWAVAMGRSRQTTCSQISAEALGIAQQDAWRFDPCTLHAAFINRPTKAAP